MIKWDLVDQCQEHYLRTKRKHVQQASVQSRQVQKYKKYKSTIVQKYKNAKNVKNVKSTKSTKIKKNTWAPAISTKNKIE